MRVQNGNLVLIVVALSAVLIASLACELVIPASEEPPAPQPTTPATSAPVETPTQEALEETPVAPPTESPAEETPPAPPGDAGDTGALIDDFEGGDFDERWWSYTEEGAIPFDCVLDGPGRDSEHAMHLSFEIGPEAYPSCGMDVTPEGWEDASGLSFFWRANQPGLAVLVTLGVEDPTQSVAEGTTPFEAVLETPGDAWTQVILVWDNFSKAEWVGDSGVDELDLAAVNVLYIEVDEGQTGSIWIDDLRLVTDGGDAAVPGAGTGVDYYVAGEDPGASDENNGLYPEYQGGVDGPWRTIQHAAQAMQAGGTTYVRTGVYNEAGITFANSGAQDERITLARYQEEEVIIDGSGVDEGLPGIAILEGQGHYIIQGLTIRNMTWSGIATDEDAKTPFEDITIRDCVLYDNHWSGIDLMGVHGFLVEDVEAYGNGFYGMNIGSSDDGGVSSADGEVRDSSFHNHTDTLEEGHGMAINQGHDIVVRDSVAYHNTIHGFDVSDWPKYGELSYNITFEGNLSYDNGLAGFAINSDSHHVVYRNNVAWRNGAAWAGPGVMSGFLCYEGCWHVEWVNNVSLENSDAGFWVEEGLGTYGTPEDNLLVFKNNIAYDNDPRGYAAALVIEGKDTWQVVAMHNNWSVRPGFKLAVINQGAEYTTADINRGAFQTGNISKDPLFVDPTIPDVQLQPNSPCIDAGVDIGLPFCGEAPDLGAMEVCP